MCVCVCDPLSQKGYKVAGKRDEQGTGPKNISLWVVLIHLLFFIFSYCRVSPDVDSAVGWALKANYLSIYRGINMARFINELFLTFSY